MNAVTSNLVSYARSTSAVISGQCNYEAVRMWNGRQAVDVHVNVFALFTYVKQLTYM